MDRDAIVQYISETFDGLDIAEHEGDFYFMYDPDRNLEPKQKQPFATLVTGDRHDFPTSIGHPSTGSTSASASRPSSRCSVTAIPTTSTSRRSIR
jgi:hypothetical protein